MNNSPKAAKRAVHDVAEGPPPSTQYSLGLIAEGPFLFLSGQGPYNPKTKKKERGTIEEQTRLTLSNLKAVIEAAGARVEDAVSCRVYLQPLDEKTFAAMNRVYEGFWGSTPPVRTTIGCQLLGMDVEIDCVLRMPRQP